MVFTHHSTFLVNIVSLSLGMLLLPVNCPGQDASIEIAPQPEFQSQLARTVKAFAKVEDHRGTDDAFRELHALSRLAGNDRVKLVEQWAYFRARATHDPEATIPLLFLQLMEVPDYAIVRALAPHMNAKHPKLREIAREQLGHVDNASGGRSSLAPLNFGEYRRYVEHRLRSKEPVPEGFVSYIFLQAPGEALLAYVRASTFSKEQANEYLWSEHVVSDAIWKKEHGFQQEFDAAKPAALEELTALSQHEQWWVRLYVAEILRRHPEFRTPLLMERLRKDEHELVRGAIPPPDASRNRGSKPGNSPTDLRYERAGQVVYVLYNEQEPVTWRGVDRFVLYKLDFTESRKEPIAFDQYAMRRYDMVVGEAHVEPNLWSAPLAYRTNRQGLLTVFKRDPDVDLRVLTIHTIPPLFLPVFDEEGVRLKEGERWTFSAPPFVFPPSVIDKIITKEVDPKTSSPTDIEFHWRDTKTINGFTCAVIDASFVVMPQGDNVREDGGQYSLKGTSYFALELGWPVLNVIRADGFFVDENGEKKVIKLQRKEVLVDAPEKEVTGR